MLADTIPHGPYFGFTRGELQVELQRYKAEVKKRSSPLASATVNGQSFTFGNRRDGSLAEWQTELQAALAYFGDAENPARNAAAVRFF